MNLATSKLPRNVFLLGYGAVGKCFSKIALNNLNTLNLTICDIYDLNLTNPSKEKFKYLKIKFGEDNINQLSNFLQKGDVIVDLSTNVDAVTIWSFCMKNGINYMNTAMEESENSDNPRSFPKSTEEIYKSSLGYRHELIEKHPLYNPNNGTTSVLEHGMNPGLISHFAKKGIIEAAEYFLKRKDWTDLNHINIEKYLKDRNYPKLAQEMGLHTIHCSETDSQFIENPPKDLKTKFYNTWSCRGFLTEGLVPIQVARGSHEDEHSEKLPRLNNGKLISSWAPSCHYWGKFFKLIIFKL
jgi:homospermidine synthase